MFRFGLRAARQGSGHDRALDPGAGDVTDDAERGSRFVDAVAPRAAVVGTPGQLAAVVARYADAGVDELISVAVVVRLVGTLEGDAQVVGLVLGHLGEPHTEGVEVEPGDAFV